MKYGKSELVDSTLEMLKEEEKMLTAFINTFSQIDSFLAKS